MILGFFDILRPIFGPYDAVIHSSFDERHSMTKTLVIGATGTVGGALVPLLAAQGHQVLQATRRPAAAPGQVTLDLGSGAGVAEALAAADRAFVMAPPGHVNQHELLGPLIAQAAERRLDKLVLMTAMGANADPTAPLRQVELQLEASGLAYNIVRPNWFMQNFNSHWLADIRQHGRIRLPVGRAKGSFIDARDIAAVAAALLNGHEHDQRDFDLTGGEALDHDEVAAVLSAAAGRPIAYEDISPDAMRSNLMAAGLPAPYADFMLVILGFFKAGYSAAVTDAVSVVTGRPPRRLADYAQDHRDAWRT